MYDANKNNNMWPQQRQRQFMVGPIPPHHPAQCHQNQSSSPHQHDAGRGVPNQRLDNHVPQQQPHHHHGVLESVPLPVPSNPRASRNMAEKQRRDNLNTNISTMAALVPAVAGSSRRMDKISILRLAAAFLRSQYTLGPGPESFLPRRYDFDLEQYIIENLVGNAGFFLVVTTLGKIVYISRHIEHQLGHAQNELLGQSLYNFVCPEDYEELQRNLTPEEIQSSSSNTVVCRSAEDGSNSSDDPTSPRTERNFTVQRRSFNIRMSQKASNKREHGQYECLQISGQLRLANACMNQANNPARPRPREINATSNDIIFVGIARLVKKRTITELSLIEATKDEYVTRHLVDGRIIFVDHRISVVAGYMTEEVSGLSAFKFMHKEDVRWTMIALRQMYDRGEGFGSSCYRLLSKTGQFIYLRTHGYLEFDKNTQTVESFVCVNTLVSEEEGSKLVKEMKERFSAVISGPARAMIMPSSPTSLAASPDAQPMDVKATVEDPLQLEDAINHLISDLPSPSISDDRQSPSPLPNNQYLKAAIFSHGLPPAVIQAYKVGINSTDCKSPPDNRVSHVARATKDSRERRNSVLSSHALSPGANSAAVNDNTATAGPATGTSFAGSVKKIVFDPPESANASEAVQVSRVDAYGNHSPAYSAPPLFEGSAGSLQGKRTPRRRTSNHVQDKERRGGKQMGNKNVSVPPKIDSRVTSTCEVARIRDRARVNSPRHVKNLVQQTMPTTINNETSVVNARKRSRADEELPATATATATASKRQATEFTANEERNIGYCEDSGSPNIGEFVAGSPMTVIDELAVGESVFNVDTIDPIDPMDTRSQLDDADLSLELGTSAEVVPLLDSSMGVYREHLNQGQALIDSANNPAPFIDDQGLAGEVLDERMLNSSLDVYPDPMKTIQEHLQSVMCNGKTIDEANVKQFKASDHAVSETIRRSHFQLEKDYALTDSQLSVLKRDMGNPALQAHRENLTQLEAEHKEHKQLLKTLQQDHMNLQANVQHNVGV